MESTIGSKVQVNTNLHHPPVRYRVHLELPLEDSYLEDRHPTKQTDLKEQQR